VVVKGALVLIGLALTIGLAQLCAPATVNGWTLLAVVLTIWGAVVGIAAHERKEGR
jgi:hypothetical protein